LVDAWQSASQDLQCDWEGSTVSVSVCFLLSATFMQVRRHMQRVLRRGPRMQKKLGEVVYKGNPSYAIMANLQLGIRYSVGRGPWPPSQAGSWLGLGGLGVGVAPWGSSGGVHKEQHVQPEQEKAGHRRQLSDALSGNTGGVLTAADFEEKRTLYFPTYGRCVTLLLVGGGAKVVQC
jgi:hypothetical protein